MASPGNLADLPSCRKSFPGNKWSFIYITQTNFAFNFSGMYQNWSPITPKVTTRSISRRKSESKMLLHNCLRFWSFCDDLQMAGEKVGSEWVHWLVQPGLRGESRLQNDSLGRSLQTSQVTEGQRRAWVTKAGLAIFISCCYATQAGISGIFL